MNDESTDFGLICILTIAVFIGVVGTMVLEGGLRTMSLVAIVVGIVIVFVGILYKTIFGE